MKFLNIFLKKFLLILFVALPFISCSQVAQKKKPVKAKAITSSSEILPDVGRYQCYRLGSISNQVAPDLTIISADTYESMGKKGKYNFDPATKIIKWVNGPLYQPSQNWVGVFLPKGTITEKGGKTVSTLIEIRKMSDIKEGNLRVLQSCACDK